MCERPITVKDILEYLAGGMSREEILEDFPYLENEDITAALDFAAHREDHLTLAAAFLMLLLDHNLSPKLIGRLGDELGGIDHVDNLGKADDSDIDIWEYTKTHGFTGQGLLRAQHRRRTTAQGDPFDVGKLLSGRLRCRDPRSLRPCEKLLPTPIESLPRSPLAVLSCCQL